MPPDWLWNTISMCPLLLIACMVHGANANVVLSVAMVAVVLASTVHHWNLENHAVNAFTSFTVDCVAQALLLSLLIGAELGLVPTTVWVVVGGVVAAILVTASTFITYGWRMTSICSLCMTVMYVGFICTSARYLTPRTMLLFIPPIALFLIGNLCPAWYRVAWPCMHASAMLVFYSILLDMGSIEDVFEIWPVENPAEICIRY